MTTLTDFLLARIAEDEEVARAGEDEWDTPAGVAYTRVGLGSSANWVHTIDLARLLAECEAKRRIVHEFTGESPHANYDDCGDECVGNALHWVLRVLAQPYADHPDYREEWRA